MIKKCGTTPETIHALRPKEVFVFGSNLAGIHGAGAAHLAKKWGAHDGRGIGLSGQTYAIPTKDHAIQSLTPPDIRCHIEDFHEFAEANPQLDFLVTKIGCGLAGFAPQQIAPLFHPNFLGLANVCLPYEFINILIDRQEAT